MDEEQMKRAIDNAGEILDDDYLKAKNVAIQESNPISRFIVKRDSTIIRRCSMPTQIRKPKNSEFFRTYIELSDAFECYILEVKYGMSTSYYIVSQEIAGMMHNQVKLCALQIVITNMGSTFIWPLKTYGTQEGENRWNYSAWNAATVATEQWVKLLSNIPQEQYDLIIATADYPEPQWPIESYEEIITKAFLNKMINSINHPVLKKFRGEI